MAFYNGVELPGIKAHITDGHTDEEMEIARQESYDKGFEEGNAFGASAGYQNGLVDGEEIGIAKGIEQGETQGKLELLADSEYMNANVSDTAIAVNDVNSIEHNVNVQLTSNTITDFSGVEVSQYGKNLCSYTIPKGVINGVEVPLNLPLGTYTFSANIKAEMTLNAYLFINRKNNDGATANVIRPIDSKKYNPMSFVIEPNIEYYIYLYCGVSDYMYNTFADLQIEVGTTATAYEEYIEPTTYTSNTDGTVEGVKSIAPNMTLLTNNSDVVINANYLRDIDTYINNLITDVALSGGE